jgi:hypothetical protein
MVERDTCRGSCGSLWVALQLATVFSIGMNHRGGTRDLTGL